MKLASNLLIAALLLIFVASAFGEFTHDHSEDVTAIKQLLDDIEQRIRDQMDHHSDALDNAIKSLNDNVQTFKDAWDEASNSVAHHEGKVAQAQLALNEAEGSLADATTAKNHAKQAYDDAVENANNTEEELREEEAQKKAHLEAELAMVDRLRTLLDKILNRTLKAEGEHCDEHYSCLPGLTCSNEVCVAQ